MKKLIASCVTALFLIGCADGGSTHNAGKHYNYTFAVDNQGWSGGFSDYSKALEPSYMLQFHRSTLPAPLNESDGAMRFSGNNIEGDLFMFMKTRLNALDVNATYEVTFTVEFASNVANGTVQAEAVTLKAGAAGFEPIAAADGGGYVRLNVDKGNQSSRGTNTAVMGNISNGSDEEVYRLRTVSNEVPVVARSDENGTLWLIVGADSAYERTTTFYYNTVTVDLKKREE